MNGLNSYINIQHLRWNIIDVYLKHAKRQGPIDRVVLYQHFYIFVTEDLAIKIKRDPNIKGYSINADEIKSNLHADDLIIAVKIIFDSLTQWQLYPSYVITHDPK